MYFRNIYLVCTIMEKLPQFSKLCIDQNGKISKEKQPTAWDFTRHPDALD